jgi:FkbM family methyltransferase
MNPKLIYDVGMHNGDDTAYYLHRGFQVVAVEADPDLAAAGGERFATAVDSGRLTIVNAAIAEQRGEADFWICDQLRVWNSFDKSIASRNGLPCHSIKVVTLPLRDLLAKHGVPYYLKLDIEGHDHVAATDISPEDAPEFVSLEINSVDDFWLLRSKGYRRFKCIQQGYFRPVLSPRLSLVTAVDGVMTRVKSTPLANRLRAAYRSMRPAPPPPTEPGTWAFAPGSSGPFGDDTPGEWLPFENVLHAWLSQQLGHQLGYRAQPPGIDVWYDLHACRS